MRFVTMLALIGSLGTGLVGCGGGLSEKDACNQAMAAMCERRFACEGAAGLATMGSYTTAADCTAGMQAMNCNPASCEPGETYHSDQAKTCVDALKNQVCSALDTEPASCALVCSAGGSRTAGAGGGMAGAGGIGGTGGAGAGGLSEVDACKQGTAAICSWSFNCQGLNGLTDLGYSSVAECTTGMQANCNTSACEPGQTYHPEQAPICLAAIKSMACSSTLTMPASCGLMCSGSGTATGGAGGGSSGGIGGTGGAGGGIGGIGGTGGIGGGTAGSTGTGQLSAQQACMQVMAGICSRTFACSGQVGLSTLGNYTTVAACTTGEQAANCATPADAACGAGETYHADQGKACADAVAVWSCADLASDTTPAACALVCTGGSGGSGGTSGTGGSSVGGNGGTIGGTGGASGGSGGTTFGTAGASGSTGTGTSSGGLSAQDACMQVMAGICSRTFACSGQAGLIALGSYTTVAACTSAEQASSCATAAQSACDVGLTYNANQGKACADAIAVWSCADMASSTIPTSCDLMCS